MEDMGIEIGPSDTRQWETDLKPLSRYCKTSNVSTPTNLVKLAF